jgi:hypothetical protein
MRVFRQMRRAVGRALAMLLCSLAASVASPALAEWPKAVPAQPLVQAPRVCALGITNLILNRRCKVRDFARIGHFEGHDWYYAFYSVRWADRHGTIERAYPIFFYLQQPATLRLGLWIHDEPGLAGQWARVPPVRPVIIERPDGLYMGVTLHAVRGQDVQRLFRLKDDMHWASVSVLYRSDEDMAVLDAATPKWCIRAGDGAYDWANFRFHVPLTEKGGGEPCGTIVTGLAIKKDKAYLVDAVVEPRSPDAPALSGPPSLTSKAAATISPSR